MQGKYMRVMRIHRIASLPTLNSIIPADRPRHLWTSRHKPTQRFKCEVRELLPFAISPTPGIRQVSAPSCATSSPHCPRTLHGFLHSNGGGTISSTPSSPTFQPIFCMSIPTAKAHSCGTPVSTGKADIYDKSHFSGFTVLPISPVILSVPISPLL